jgi:hypothetical protein
MTTQLECAQCRPRGDLMIRTCTCGNSSQPIADKPTVGEMALKLGAKDERQSVIDTQRAMQSGYTEQLIKCAKRYPEWTDPFYVCVETRRERLLTNVIRCQFYGRQTRPMPQYDLALYHYDPRDENLRFVWCVPDKESVECILDDFRSGMLPVEHYPLAAFCAAFKANTLI